MEELEASAVQFLLLSSQRYPDLESLEFALLAFPSIISEVFPGRESISSTSRGRRKAGNLESGISISTLGPLLVTICGQGGFLDTLPSSPNTPPWFYSCCLDIKGGCFSLRPLGLLLAVNCPCLWLLGLVVALSVSLQLLQSLSDPSHLTFAGKLKFKASMSSRMDMLIFSSHRLQTNSKSIR